MITIEIDTILTKPSAMPVIQALRNIGYNSQTAIADIIDNSIDARASIIKITFRHSDINDCIFIQDDGIGMTEEELQIAMTIGSKDPREKRKESELGRFGMGLKTASFSLGKRLSVLTKKDGVVSERCWDLDYISAYNEWYLFREIPEEIKSLMGEIENDNGTIIYIDKLDRFSGYDTPKKIKDSSYYAKINRIKRYLEMVFHLRIEEGLIIEINDNLLEPWDPFLRDNERTIEGETQAIRVNGKKVIITPYILPHPSLFNQKEHSEAGGIKGWRDQQGFYIYRGNRLVNFGEWFGLFTKDSVSELTRIKIDFSNDSDEDWKIDIKKSSISIPDEAKEDLRSIGKYYRQISKEIMLYRTKPVKVQGKIRGTLNSWELANDEIDSSYVLNRTHPVLINILKTVDENIRKQLNMYLKLVELGSPNNLLQTSALVKKENQILDDTLKYLIIELSNTLYDVELNITLDSIVEAISLITGFESVDREAIKQVIERNVLDGSGAKKKL